MRLWKRFKRPGIPEYLARHYWWAYLWHAGVWFFDHQPIINAILFGQYRKLMAATLGRISNPVCGRVLQLTAVYGDFTSKLARRLTVGEFHLADVVAIQLKIASRKLGIIQTTRGHSNFFAQMNAESLAYADNSFDTVVIFFLLHEMPASARRRTISEALRVLRAGGASFNYRVRPIHNNARVA